ncbi:response regulator [Desulfitobacterium hafniense]|uniref:response regulator n=1 Tax=Desulfitobacterium hafniense TaxID=49338 RepID=UPI00035D0FED|nr:response regulator transcription factor [Desulfitobacterium hafniense]
MRLPIRVFLVDDHTLVRNGLKLLLENEPDIEVIGEAENAAMAISQVVSLSPDVVLMDLSLPDTNGIEVTHQIYLANPTVRVVALTMHAVETYLLKFLEAGGVGYVHKSAADRDLVKAIHSVMEGQIFLQPDGIQLMARKHHAPQSETHEISPDVLSEREHQVLELIARGYTCREIGLQLSLSHRTIETYRERITEKLELQHRSQLVEYALRHNILGQQYP